MLLERPRVATVVAEGDVRTLVIDGDGLTHDPARAAGGAMAMLQTLAERISQQ